MKVKPLILPASAAKGLTRSERAVLMAAGALPIVTNDCFIETHTDGTGYKARQERIQILYGGSGAGKSDWKATELLLKAMTQPFFRCLFVRKNKEQVRDSQFLLFKGIIERNNLAPFFHVKESEMDIVCNLNGNMLLSGGLDDVDKLKSIPDVTDIWIEEPIDRKGSVLPTDFTELNRRLRCAKASNHVHLTFNPISKGSWIYDYFFRKEIYQVFAQKVTYKDNHFLPENTESEYHALSLIAPDEYRVYGLGEWGVVNDEMRLFADDAIADMFTNSFVQGSGQKYITADVAFQGADKFVIMVWDGWVVTHVYQYDKTEGDEVVKIIQSIAATHQVPGRNVCFDAGGVGMGLRGFLRSAVSFVGASMPLDNTPKMSGQLVKRPQYQNLRSQCFFLLKKKVEANDIYFSVKGAALRESLTRELQALQQHGDMDADKLAVTPKKDLRKVLGSSIDLADALSMRVVFDLLPVRGTPFERPLSRG